MAEYSIVFARSARKELHGLDHPVTLRLLKRIESLAANPRPAGVLKLEGATDLWRVRVGNGALSIALTIARTLST